MRRRPLAAVCLSLAFLIYLGTLLVKYPEGEWNYLNGQVVIATGEVYQKEVVRQTKEEKKILYLKLRMLEQNGQQILSKKKEKINIICYLKSNQKTPELGSVVQVKGTVSCFEKATNPGQFDKESYYRILQISFQLNQTEIQKKSSTYHKIGETLFQIKQEAGSLLEDILPDKEASVMKTMLLGEKREADTKIKKLYTRSGIVHILAISGLHISLLGMTLFKLLRKCGLPDVLQVGISFGGIWLYVCMTGFSVSASRALIMFGFQMLACLCKRTYDLITAAMVALVLLLLEQPLYLQHSGFLFSFGCIFAIAFVVPVMTQKSRQAIRGILAGSSITLACLPIQLWYFGYLSVYSSFLNLMVIPLMSFLVPAGILLLAIGKIISILENFGILAKGFGLCLQILRFFITGVLGFYEEACFFVEKLPFHLWITGRPTKWQIVLYLLILIGLVCFYRKKPLLKKWTILLVGVACLIWQMPQEMAVTFLDVGQGDCIHIRSKEGYHYLVDGGSSDVTAVGEYRILPYLREQGISRLEAVFVTHPDEDHCNGILELFVLAKEEGVEIQHLFLPDVSLDSRTESYQKLVEAAKEAGIAISFLSKGQVLTEGELSFVCLHPSKGYECSEANEYSLVLMVEYQNFQALLTGDVEGAGEKAMIEAMKKWRKESGSKTERIEILKVAHHGSRYSTTEELLALGKPKVAIISCGEDNSYGHPHEETISRLFAADCEVFATPEYGAITVEVGEEIRVSGFLK